MRPQKTPAENIDMGLGLLRQGHIELRALEPKLNNKQWADRLIDIRVQIAEIEVTLEDLQLAIQEGEA